MKNLYYIIFLFGLFCQAQLQQVISQTNYFDNNIFEDQPDITWGASDAGAYPDLSGVVKVDVWVPTSEEASNNHHPFLENAYGDVFLSFSTTNSGEENPGQFVRYTKTSDYGETWSTIDTLFPSMDDISKDRAIEGGRVIIPAGFAIVDGELYGLGDVNDRDSDAESSPTRKRIGVGIVARKINNNGTLGTIYWIDNIDNSFTSPSPVSGFPSYAFNISLRTSIKRYFYEHPEKRPTWHFSVPVTDFLRTRYLTIDEEELCEPSITQLPNGQWLKLWRPCFGAISTDRKRAQTSVYGYIWSESYETQIPDSPSRSEIITLYNNVVMVVGNNQTGRRYLFTSFSSNGYNYAANNVYIIDEETAGPTYPNPGKGTGVQYPYPLQMDNGKVIVAYSVNKEDIRVATFNIPVLN